MQKEHTVIIGGGPCGLSCAIELQNQHIMPLIIEKDSIVNTIYNFPTHQMFFSTSEKLEIGDVAFITEKQKPVRNQALAYYRSVAERKKIRLNPFERVIHVKKMDQFFSVQTELSTGQRMDYEAQNVIIATGYYDQPNYLDIPGENLVKVMHYFKEAHPYFNKDVLVIGGKNSAVDATLELHKAGANVTVLYRGETYSKSVKPWILPEFDALVRKDKVKMEFNAEVLEITNDHVLYAVEGEKKAIANDFVFAMTGYKPDLDFLKQAGIEIDRQNGKPQVNEKTFETNVPGVYVAGVIAAGYNNNEIFIENGRHHGKLIANAITNGK